jgi:hypothetical protein
MATFTNTMSVSSVDSTVDKTGDLYLVVERQKIPDVPSNLTGEVAPITYTMTYTETGALLSTYFQLFRCIGIFFGSDPTAKNLNIKPPRNHWHN